MMAPPSKDIKNVSASLDSSSIVISQNSDSSSSSSAKSNLTDKVKEKVNHKKVDQTSLT